MGNRDGISVREIVGLNVVKLRTAAGLSQNDLGVRLEQWYESSWSRQAVSQAEQGKRAFGVDDLVALCVGLDASIQQLLTPPKEVENIVLASGSALSASTYEGVVLGGVEEMDEVQLSRIVGHLGEINFLAGVLASRQEALRACLNDDDEGRRATQGASPTDEAMKLYSDFFSKGNLIRDVRVALVASDDPGTDYGKGDADAKDSGHA